MATLIRRVDLPNGQTTKVIPPDGGAHAGAIDWKVINPTGSGGTAELVDAGDKVAGAGHVLAAGDKWESRGRDTEVWAVPSAHISVVVTGTTSED